MTSRADHPPREHLDAEGLTPACAWARAQAAPLALGMLDPEETGRVYDHLLLCPACDAAVGRLTSMTSLLGLTVDQLEPPSGARPALLARVATDGYEREATSRRRLAPLPAATTVRRWRPTLAANRWLAPLAVVAVLVAGSFGFQGAFSSTDEVARLQRENDRLAAATHQFSLSIGREKFGDDALLYTLMAVRAGETGAGGVLLGDPSEPRASLSIWNLIEEPGDYTVTVESLDGTRSDAGAVTIDQRGVGTLDLRLFQPIATYRVVHVAAAGQPEIDVFTLRLDQGAGGLDLVQQLGE